MVTYEEQLRQGGEQAIRMVSEFFGQDDALYRTLKSLTSRLTELNISYAISGGLAMVAHGCARTEKVIEILIRQQAIEKLGALTDEIRIDFVIAGSCIGDGKLMKVRYPDPAEAAVEIDGIHYLQLEKLIDLRLASGMTGGMSRLKDLADVVELIKTLNLPLKFAQKIDPDARDKFIQLWTDVRDSPDIQEQA